MKKAAVVLAAGLLLFALFTIPAEFGDAVKTFLGWLEDGAVAVITFVKSVFT